MPEFDLIIGEHGEREVFCTMKEGEEWPQTAVECLELSIKKWEFICDQDLREDPDSEGERNSKDAFDCGGVMTCALCKRFYKSKDGLDCVGCPVNEETGYVHCAGSPFDHFSDDECLVHARWELAFLESLRPLARELDAKRMESPKDTIFILEKGGE